MQLARATRRGRIERRGVQLLLALALQLRLLEHLQQAVSIEHRQRLPPLDRFGTREFNGPG